MTRSISTSVSISVVGILVVAALLLSGCSVADRMAVATSAETDEQYQNHPVAPAPPLPVAAPTVNFDPANEIADVDGSVVVRLNDEELQFASSEGVDSVPVTDAGELRAVSAAGDRAAVFHRRGDTSVITVIESEHGVSPMTFELPGLVEPEAFSTDGELLFVIDHQVSRTDGAYRVRPLDLASGELLTITGPSKIPLLDDMNGSGRRQVWTPGGSRLNTLYIRQTHHHHDTTDTSDTTEELSDHGHGEPGTDGFVHVLDLDQEWAHCLDLPPAFGGGELTTTALAVSPDGSLLAVADLAAGQLALASADELRVTEVLDLPQQVFELVDGASPNGDVHLGITDDAIVFGSGDQIAWFDLKTLEPLGSPISIGSELSGLTPTGASVLAWPATSAAPPRQLQPPTA